MAETTYFPRRLILAGAMVSGVLLALAVHMLGARYGLDLGGLWRSDTRDFITALHQRMAAAGSKAALTGGLSKPLYVAAVVLLALLGFAMAGLMVRALMTREWSGVLFLIGFAALFAWQIGGFVTRNRPISYSFDRLPAALLP